MKLYKTYGDHLFRRGDFEGAVNQYSHTIGFVPASYVIRRFLDSQRIGHLTSYLEKLHSKGFASKDLTTLLLTCYTKTRDVERLDAFIAQGDAQLEEDDSPIKLGAVNESNKFDFGDSIGFKRFDLSAAISTLRRAGYTTYAMKLALRHGEHDGYLSMLLDPFEGDPADEVQDNDNELDRLEGKVDAGDAAFNHLVGIVDAVVSSVKYDVDNSHKYTTTASSNAAQYMTRRNSNGSTLRIRQETNDKLDALLLLLKRHGRRILFLRPDAMTGLLIMLYTGVPYTIVRKTPVRTQGLFVCLYLSTTFHC